MAVTALVIAGLSAIAALLAVLYTRRVTVANEKLLAIETERWSRERQAHEEGAAAARSAEIRLWVESQPAEKSKNFYLVVANTGLAVADGVIVEFASPVGTGGEWRFWSEPGPMTLNPDEQRRLGVGIYLGSAAAMNCSVRWDDADGPHEATLEARLPGW